MGAGVPSVGSGGGDSWVRALSRRQVVMLGIAAAATLLAGLLAGLHANAVAAFVVAGIALAVLAALVGEATDQLGERLGPGATGVLQSALGNLPELFVAIFALRAGLVTVVQSALVGSILANSLLVLGLALTVGGLRHGTQRFASEAPRMTVTLSALAVSALAIPTLAAAMHTPADTHLDSLSVVCAVVLLLVFAASIPFSIRSNPPIVPDTAAQRRAGGPAATWPPWLAGAVLAAAGVAAAVVSDWFVTALEPAIAVLHLSQAFTGLVIVAIAGNAVENVVGIQLAARNKPDYAMSVILNSSLQVALGLTPLLVLLSFVVGGAHLTLVMPGLLVAALGLTTIISALIVYDGESIWLEGIALIGLYGIIAAAFWWG